ncbi:uncharacterized protein GGS22DRAFT_154869 [Annulohypoxylon maeteangense]|uniref:uncharacterized protein n=1 Tax=Annulohypoxylon maeteangense TaxID=1927788 RepID=UPI002007E845|nr:uncharacterized protein GGS22DRAFT_154869 [Annulohypoxylon maeteangense]KAI0888020.1 hypothetical protein GGS22DRAFT_154869 [Annulohypoxylon maeteangense]
MQFKASLATLALTTGLTAAYDPTPFVSPLQPWQIPRFTISLPPNKLGAAGYATIKLAVSNPNQVSAGPAPHAAGGGYLPFAPSAANCTSTGHDTPAAMNGSCVETSQDSYGVWQVGVISTDATAAIDPRDVQVRLTLTYNVTRWNAVWFKVYQATARFSLDENLVLGECADHDRHCSYELNPDLAPLEVEPEMVDCRGTCSNDP